MDQSLGFLQQKPQWIGKVVLSELESGDAAHPGSASWHIAIQPLDHVWDNGKDGLHHDFLYVMFNNTPSGIGSPPAKYQEAWTKAGVPCSSTSDIVGRIAVFTREDLRSSEKAKSRWANVPYRVLAEYTHEGELPVRAPSTPDEQTSGAVDPSNFNSQPAQTTNQQQMSTEITAEDKAVILAAIDGKPTTQLSGIIANTAGVNKSHIKMAAIDGSLVKLLVSEGLLTDVDGIFKVIPAQAVS